MKKRRNIRRILPVALLMILILACGSVYAYMFGRTNSASTTFIPAKVSCEVDETFEENQKRVITIKNTSNVDAYLRVRLVTYWIDGNGNVAPKSSPALSVDYDKDRWVAGSSNNTFYYKVPVASYDPASGKGITETLLKTPITLRTEDGYRQVVDVFAEAIQSNPTSAVTEAWHVTLFEGSTTIESAP